jgi:hypothetical protein
MQNYVINEFEVYSTEVVKSELNQNLNSDIFFTPPGLGLLKLVSGIFCIQDVIVMPP